ncbi:hypothetical protein ABBQ38_000830 [Trebouxia sp. C0009 RCD-2024]
MLARPTWCLVQNKLLVYAGNYTAYRGHYAILDPDRYYIKLDDDIMYIGQHAFEAMLYEKLQGRFMFVSANVVNHGVLTWVHAGMDAMHTSAAQLDRLGDSPYRRRIADATKTNPMTGCTYGYSTYCSVDSASVAAACHYSFLHNVRKQQLHKYNFHIWDFHAFGYQAWSINTFIFKGSELHTVKFDEDVNDEWFISQRLAERLDSHSGAVGSALVVHMSYHTQRESGFDESDVLHQYEQLAESLTGVLLPR